MICKIKRQSTNATERRERERKRGREREKRKKRQEREKRKKERGRERECDKERKRKGRGGTEAVTEEYELRASSEDCEGIHEASTGGFCVQ